MRKQLRVNASLALVAVAGLLLACVNDFDPRPLQALPGTAALGRPADPDRFTFYVFGDNRPAKKGDPPTATIQAIAGALAQNKPALALSCGDLIAGKEPGDRARIEAEYSAVLDVLKSAHVPVFNAPGNHEMDDKDDVPNATMTQFYSELIGLPYGSFDYGNSHFVSLNTEEIAPPGTAKSPRAPLDGSSGTLDPGFITEQQRAWLDADLWAHQSARHVFVFMHHSVHAHKTKNQLDRASAEALLRIFAKYKNVTAVFSAHEHIYYNPQAPDDVANPMAGSTAAAPRYLVTGGAGAPLESGDHGFYHYLVVTVSGGNMQIELVKVP